MNNRLNNPDPIATKMNWEQLKASVAKPVPQPSF